MWPYLALAALLILLFWIDNSESPSSRIRYGALILLIVFVGLRFELGYDWVAYERFFEFIPGDLSLQSYDLSRTILPTEPVFYFINVLIKKIGGGFEFLLFLLAAFNLIVIDRLCQKLAPNSQLFLWIFYFCLAMLAIQFNILRQAAASSFVLLSLMSAADGRKLMPAVYFAIGLGIHVSILMFLPIFLAFRYKVRVPLIIGAVVLLAGVFISGAILGGTLIGAVGTVLPDFLGSKADNYSDSLSGGQLSGVSPLSLLLVLVYLAYLKIMIPRNRDLVANIAIALTLLVLAAHLGVSQFPSLWNRIMCVSLPWQLAALWRTGFFQEAHAHWRRIALGFAQVAVVAVMAFQLGRPQSEPFVPYHSLIQVWLFNDYGTGRVKAIYAIDQAERQPI